MSSTRRRAVEAGRLTRSAAWHILDLWGLVGEGRSLCNRGPLPYRGRFELGAWEVVGGCSRCLRLFEELEASPLFGLNRS